MIVAPSISPNIGCWESVSRGEKGVSRCGKLFLPFCLLLWAKKGTQKVSRIAKLFPRKLCTTFPHPYSHSVQPAKVAGAGRSSGGWTVSPTLSTPFIILLYSIISSLSLKVYNKRKGAGRPVKPQRGDALYQ